MPKEKINNYCNVPSAHLRTKKTYLFCTFYYVNSMSAVKHIHQYSLGALRSISGSPNFVLLFRVRLVLAKNFNTFPRVYCVPGKGFVKLRWYRVCCCCFFFFFGPWVHQKTLWKSMYVRSYYNFGFRKHEHIIQNDFLVWKVTRFTAAYIKTKR